MRIINIIIIHVDLYITYISSRSHKTLFPQQKQMHDFAVLEKKIDSHV